ncbi:hypothetical protein C2S53_013882 [Perilla frutescens var. hirtella]|uniref:F-box domain-containing protein n=1 Tax=Perilla frutescens var. hirtella TaxID=608512 RepID=A0AAD4JHR1_PERFH|nr:hypothetical protein C2S53_013882 [Perilla frutescens var. hirtella]
MPPQQTKRATKNRHIPMDTVEEILLNLSVKSLLRFSSVSKSWNSMIFEPRFIKKYHGRERFIVLNPFSYDNIINFRSCPLSTVFSDNPIEENLIDFTEKPTHIRAFCNELWCAENTEYSSLFLLNPSMRTCRKLPAPKFPPLGRNQSFVYGLGYDSAGDDYKILKILYCSKGELETELYSLRSDSWRKILAFPTMKISCLSFCSFVNGALHWLCHWPESSYAVVSFDLSTEEYGEVELPEHSPTINLLDDKVNVAVSSGKFCFCLSYRSTRNFVLWVMEEYGVVESWTKKFNIDCDIIPGLGNNFRWKPLHFCENGQILMVAFMYFEKNGVIFMYGDDKTLLRKDFGRSKISECLVYVDSLVSP